MPGNGNLPPWAASISVQSTLPATANPTPLESALNSPASAVGAQQNLIKLKTMQQELAASMRDGKQPDPKKVVALLTEIKRTNGSTVAGVNLDAVLNNLEQSQKIQALAIEIQHENAKPGGPDKKVLAAHFEKLKQLQSQLRMDISAPQKTEAAK
jgi:murein L,D-transpeptidase YcbB/YkuD